MKTLSKQTNKWILSTALIAALGSQYYFSASSQAVHTIEMSSTAPVIEKKGKYIVVTSAEDKAKAETAARAYQITCSEGCGKMNFEGTEKQLEEFLKITAAVATTPAAEKKEIKAAKAEPVETAAERRAREKEEREEAKAILKAEKDDALAEAQAERNEKFLEQIDKASDKCESKTNKLECFTNEFARILAKFQRKNTIDQKIVNTAFYTHIEKELKAKLASIQSREEAIVALENEQGPSAQTQLMRSDLTKLKIESLGIIETLESKIPSNYSILKNKTIDIVKSVSVSAALAVNNNYKAADQLYKAKKNIEAGEALKKAKAGHEALVVNAKMHEVEISKALQGSDSSEALNYFTTSYMPDMTKILANLTNLQGNKIVSDTSSPSTTLNQPSNDSGRNSRSGSPAANATQSNQSTTNGVTWGTATSTPTGTRLGNQVRP